MNGNWCNFHVQINPLISFCIIVLLQRDYALLKLRISSSLDHFSEPLVDSIAVYNNYSSWSFYFPSCYWYNSSARRCSKNILLINATKTCVHTKYDGVKNNKPATVNGQNKAIVTYSETWKPSRQRCSLELLPKHTIQSGQNKGGLVYLCKEPIYTREIEEMVFDICTQWHIWAVLAVGTSSAPELKPRQRRGESVSVLYDGWSCQPILARTFPTEILFFVASL